MNERRLRILYILLGMGILIIGVSLALLLLSSG